VEEYIIKSPTYASIATIVFIKHKNQISKSIESAIRATDNLCKQFGLANNLSHMTKYRIISDLIQSKILTSTKTAKQKKLKLAQKINTFFP
jgi:hypothetical protein